MEDLEGMVMRLALSIIGVILILAGIVWFFQGIGVIPGSFMTGRSQYAVLGVITGVIGAGLLWYANRRRRMIR